MPSLYPAPTEQTLEAFLTSLAPVPAHVARLASADPDREPTGLMAEFVTDGNTIAAIAFADHDVVNFVGGAIASVEATTVQEANSMPTLHESAVTSFREVADGIATSLNGEFTPTVRLANVHQLPGELSDEIKELWRRPRGKRAFRLTVDDYGAGNVILYLG